MFTLQITQNHIDEARTFSSTNCPIARAILEKFSSKHKVEVHYNYIAVKLGKTIEALFAVNPETRFFMYKFDRVRDICKPTLIELGRNLTNISLDILGNSVTLGSHEEDVLKHDEEFISPAEAQHIACYQ